MCLFSCKGPISMANHNSRRYSNEPIRYQSYLWLAEGRENGWARATQDTIFGGWAPDWLGRDFSANRRALKSVALTGLLSTTNWRSLIFVSRYLQTINNTADVMLVRHSWPFLTCSGFSHTDLLSIISLFAASNSCLNSANNSWKKNWRGLTRFPPLKTNHLATWFVSKLLDFTVGQNI